MKDLTIDILNSVEHPARYIGGEFASIIKKDAKVRIALAFPDVYEVGMSYLGFKILYHLVNVEEGLAAERVYAPWTDMETKMREQHLPLRTLETEVALRDCDFVGFTLQYEMSYTNILNMMDLGGVPLWTKDRKEDDPFVIVGGPCVFNPEPLAEFFDFAVVGDGEEVLVEV
ncbi:MAG: cobalamin-dependent protein, partial [Phascolarctobacterium sp.]|nr:cobalamin-dependent protein [Candidatus Phascolarctobacterium equi]